MSGSLFPTITHTGAQPIYGTGSGGGSNTPNPQVSTIQVAQGGSINFSNGTASTFSLVYDQLLTPQGQLVSTLVFESINQAVTTGLDLGVGGLYIQGDGSSVGSANTAFLNFGNNHLAF